MSAFTITNAAAKRICELASDESQPVLLRVVVQGGGCYGFQYSFAFDTHVQEEDKVIEAFGAKVVIDTTSLEILDGSELDYKEDLIGASFVLNNPNAASSCGCGNSFSL